MWHHQSQIACWKVVGHKKGSIALWSCMGFWWAGAVIAAIYVVASERSQPLYRESGIGAAIAALQWHRSGRNRYTERVALERPFTLCSGMERSQPLYRAMVKNKCSNIGFRRMELDTGDAGTHGRSEGAALLYLAADGVEDTMYEGEWLGF